MRLPKYTQKAELSGVTFVLPFLLQSTYDEVSALSLHVVGDPLDLVFVCRAVVASITCVAGGQCLLRMVCQFAD